jgi:hypothetical protein
MIEATKTGFIGFGLFFAFPSMNHEHDLSHQGEKTIVTPFPIFFPLPHHTEGKKNKQSTTDMFSTTTKIRPQTRTNKQNEIRWKSTFTRTCAAVRAGKQPHPRNLKVIASHQRTRLFHDYVIDNKKEGTACFARLR